MCHSFMIRFLAVNEVQKIEAVLFHVYLGLDPPFPYEVPYSLQIGIWQIVWECICKVLTTTLSIDFNYPMNTYVFYSGCPLS